MWASSCRLRDSCQLTAASFPWVPGRIAQEIVAGSGPVLPAAEIPPTWYFHAPFISL